MKAKEREIRRKKRILDHAVESGNIAKTCRYFGSECRPFEYACRRLKLRDAHRVLFAYIPISLQAHS